ncbi:MAG: hypothetical protein LKF47_03250 [Megasphaera sp.]|nr:hypothetical protein [Megasphaera sp.]MCI1247761.1 hypothetical protein [Megasphaera sp.]
MIKLKRFLWAIVFIYLLYALIKDGVSIEIGGLFALAVVVYLVQELVNSTAYKKWKNHKIQNHKR